MPGDLSLICFDDVDWFSFTDPSVTAVASSHTRLAEAALTLLLSRIETVEQRHRAPVLMEISFELMLRNSTAVPLRGALVLRNGGSDGG